MRVTDQCKHRNARAALATIGVLLAVAEACAAEHYSGEARAKDGTFLYREQHWLYREHDVDTRLVLYTCADGKPFTRKQVWARSSARAPEFTLEDARDGYSEGVRSHADARVVFVRTGKDVPVKEAPLSVGANTAIDAGFDSFVRTYWETLLQGRSVPLAFVVPSRLTAIDFTVERVGEEVIDSHSAQRFRLAVAHWFGGLLPHIDVSYDSQTRTLLRYAGISNIRGAGGRNLDVYIAFAAEKHSSDANDADIATAENMPLNGSCKL